jgi:hypothetical protein
LEGEGVFVVGGVVVGGSVAGEFVVGGFAGAFFIVLVVVGFSGAGAAGGFAGEGGSRFRLGWGKGFFGRGSCFRAVPLCINRTRDDPMAPEARMRTKRGTLVVTP